MATIVNTKLGETKGLKRLWLEGQKLANEDYRPGDRLTIKVVDESVVLEPDPDGRYTVSRRKHRTGRYLPIIDLTAKELAEMFDGVDMLRVAIQKGRILITAHHSHTLVAEREGKLIRKLANNEPLDVVSLFHGGGVLERALHDGYARAGIKTRLAVVSEISSKYLDCSMRNNRQLWDEHTIAIEGPIQDMDLRGVRWGASMLTAGLPCLGASRAGRSKNALKFAESHQEAGAMFFSTLEVIKAFNPALIWLEQVPEYLNTASWVVVKSVLESLHYDLEVRILDGHEFGALERRRRMCCLAISKGLNTRFDIEKIASLRNPEACIGDILEDVPDDSPQWKTFQYLADKAITDKAAGKGFVRQLLTPKDTRCGSIGRQYYKYRSTEPFIKHPTDERRSRIFTKGEHARLKTIPVEMIEGESESVAHEILGQSVIKCAFEAASAAHGHSLIAAFGEKEVCKSAA